MKNNSQLNQLNIWIAENGDIRAKERICREVNINPATLYRILKGSTPTFGNRYRLYKLTGVKLLSKDDFPEFKAG